MGNESYDLVESFKLMDRSQSVVEDTHGNVSVRDNDSIYIKPSGRPYGEITPYEVCHVSMDDGQILNSHNGLRPSVDTEHHRSIYRCNPRIGAICHTHSPYATAWAIAGKNLDVLCTEHADYFGHEIRCLRFASLDQWGKIFLKNTEGAILLGAHGVLTMCEERNPVKAVRLAIALESIAKKYTLAAQIRKLPNPLEYEEVLKWHDRYQNRYGQ